MRKEYNFSKGVRGKYARRYKEGTNIVLLDPDVAKVFKTSSSVNKAFKGNIRQQIGSKFNCSKEIRT
jgi:hypothetical protein